ncbi:hypothetical protein ElyMa_007046200 [Elysia marginata]|uniref:Seipin n=1 Tax=Elysia marginata TaxID=1093978 RepID=A0AAV4JVU6_9GAST|nr:hypothetical protein ElyMa_007046200 [Elysia marginata]
MALASPYPFVKSSQILDDVYFWQAQTKEKLVHCLFSAALVVVAAVVVVVVDVQCYWRGRNLVLCYDANYDLYEVASQIKVKPHCVVGTFFYQSIWLLINTPKVTGGSVHEPSYHITSVWFDIADVDPIQGTYKLDLMFVLMHFPSLMLKIVNFDHLELKTPPNDRVVLMLFRMVSGVFQGYSSFVSVVRCLCVARPLKFKSMFTKSRTLTTLGVLLLAAVVLGMLTWQR